MPVLDKTISPLAPRPSDDTEGSGHTTVLLDVDGTLLDSNEAHALSWQHALRRRGHAVPYEKVRPLIGRPAAELIAELIGPMPDPAEIRRLAEERRSLFVRSYLTHLYPMPGTRALLQRLRDDGFRLVAAGSCDGAPLKALLRQAGIGELFEDLGAAAGTQDAGHPQQIVREALARAGVPAREAILIADTPYDVAAAHAVGVDAIALRCGGWWRDVALSGALALYDDPADLLRKLATSPLAREATADLTGEAEKVARRDRTVHL